MKSFFSKFIFLFTGIVLLTSCHSDKYIKSDQIEQRIIFQLYSASYDAEKETLSILVTFKENNPTGTTIELTKQSSVSFNGEKLSGGFSEKEEYAYTIKKTGKLPSNLLFQYQNNDGKNFDNTLTINSFELKDVNSLTINKNQGAWMPFAGKSFFDDEALSLILFQNEEQIETLEIPIPSGKQISISPELLDHIALGTYSGQFSRTFYSSDVKSMDRGGWYETEYISKKIKINIVE